MPLPPKFVAALIPSLRNLFEASDTEVAEIAIQVSILCMYVIQSGDWPEEDRLADLLDMQHCARLLEVAHDDEQMCMSS